MSLAAGDGLDDRGAGVKHLINIFRRLHRIFAHAWFQHRGVFWQVEAQTGLYVLFKTVCDSYELLPAENYNTCKLPPEAEGLEPTEEVKSAAPKILKSQAPQENTSSIEEDFINVGSVGRNNTRRHIRQSPSVGSAVTTVLETDEDDSDTTQRLGEMSLTDDDAESDSGAEIPVIVENYEADGRQGLQLEHANDHKKPEHFEPTEVHIATMGEVPPPTPSTVLWNKTPVSMSSEEAEAVKETAIEPAKEEPHAEPETVPETAEVPEVKVVEEAEPEKGLEQTAKEEARSESEKPSAEEENIEKP